MKNKISIYLNMLIICLSICVISVGVYSLTSANLTISGSLGYVYHPYSVTATIQNYTTTKGGSIGSVANLSIQESTDVTTDSLWQKTKITLPDTMQTIYFDGKGYEAEYIEVLVTVKNNEDTQKAVVLLFDDITGLGYTRKVIESAETTPENITENHSSAIILSKGEQTTFRLTLKQSIKKTNLSIAQADFNIQLSVANYVASNFTASQTDTITTTGIKYTMNSDLKSWSVAENGASGDVTFEPLIQGLPVNTIAEKGFYCLSCTSIKIANSVTDVLEKGCNGDDLYAYNVYIPGSVINVGNRGFAHCYPLTLLSNNIFNFITLGNNAFWSPGTKDTTTFTVEIQNNGLTNIPESCFYGLNVAEIILQSSKISIGKMAFYACTKLTSATIQSNGISLSDGVFASCTSLDTITFLETTPPTIDSYADPFSGCTALKTIYVPSSAVETYKTAQYFSDYADKIQAIQ